MTDVTDKLGFRPEERMTLYTRLITDRSDDVVLLDRPLPDNCIDLYWRQFTLVGTPSGCMFSVRYIYTTRHFADLSVLPENIVFLSLLWEQRYFERYLNGPRIETICSSG